MKYTRYNLKKKKSNGIFFIIIICGILVLALILGTIISNFIIKDINESKSNKNPVENIEMNPGDIKNSKEKKSGEKIYKNTGGSFIAIQCGVFGSKENADILKVELSDLGNPFIIEEEGKNRVILGIYTEKEAEEQIKILKDNGKDYTRIKFVFDTNNLCDAQIYEIINGNLQIINKFSDKKVKAVETKQLKEWISKMKKIDKTSENYNKLQNVKDNSNKLPEKISKEQLSKQNIYIYNILKEMK
ncbi:SPOR domain-containing protein [Clostridium aestuarii]|uniref:SPOR domain-containing protein n=1 Tax=Clostridium aestuarii TaxID=338193 RepID=A0ABT4D1F2_9CLOT|nr:SPOR domain-containing protein [Clostridium aestuarii]MCY6485069.1 SPOR domain-containing protein [Clostridium aestuarii]